MRRALIVVALALSGCMSSPAPEQPTAYRSETTIASLILEQHVTFALIEHDVYRKVVTYVAWAPPSLEAEAEAEGTRDKLAWVSPEEPTLAKAVSDFLAHEAKR